MGASDVTIGRPVGAGRRVLRWILWVVILAVVAGGAWLGYGRYKKAKAASAPPQYYFVAAKLGSVSDTIAGTGTVDAVQTQNVTPGVTGQVASVSVQPGQAVKAGQTLVTLHDTQGYATQLQTAEANLAEAQSELTSMTDPAASVTTEDIDSAKLKVQEDQLTLEQAQANLQSAQTAATTDEDVTAPAAGNIESESVTSGQTVNTGAVIATVLPNTPPTVSVDVPESELPYLPVGTTAAIVVPSVPETVSGTVASVGTSPSGSAVPINSAGQPSSKGSTTEVSYALTLDISPALGSDVPNGATVLVAFTPSSNAPAAYTTDPGWGFSGTVVYPATVNATALQSGTVGDLAAVGATVTDGQQLATVTNVNAQTTLQSDQMAVEEDQLNLEDAQSTYSVSCGEEG